MSLDGSTDKRGASKDLWLLYAEAFHSLFSEDRKLELSPAAINEFGARLLARSTERRTCPHERSNCDPDKCLSCFAPSHGAATKHAVTQEMYAAGMKYLHGKGTAWCCTDLYLAMEEARVSAG